MCHDDQPIEFKGSTPLQRKILQHACNIDVMHIRNNTLVCRYVNAYPHIVNSATLIEHLETHAEGVCISDLYGVYPHVKSDIAALRHNKVIFSEHAEYGDIVFLRPTRTGDWAGGDGSSASEDLRVLYQQCRSVR